MDAIGEVVAGAGDSAARSVVVCGVVREIYDSIEWIHGHDDELTSLRMVLTAALDHQQRMVLRAASNLLGG